MTLALLPIGLAALTALLLPLLVHLARRSEQRRVAFAALRWLQAKAQPRRRIRFDEVMLLALRLLLLAALALLLAQPVLFGRPDRTPRVLVAPGIDVAAARADVGDVEARWHWLAPGLPGIDAADDAAPADRPSGPAATPASSSSLLREMDAALPAGTPLTVLVPDVIDRADGERPVLAREVDWRVLPAAPPPDAGERDAPALPTLMVRHAPERTDALRYLRAAGAAWRDARSAEDGDGDADRDGNGDDAGANPVTIAPVSQSLDADGRNLVWLVSGPLPDAVRDWIAAGGHALLDADTRAPQLDDAAVLWRDGNGPLVRGAALGHGRIMQLQRELRPAQVPDLLEPDFPRQLQHLFAAAPIPPARVDAREHAPLADTRAAPDRPETPRPLAPWLAVLIAALFVIERWVANGPRRRTPA